MTTVQIDEELNHPAAAGDGSLRTSTLRTWATQVALGQVYGLPSAVRRRLQAVAVESLLLCLGGFDDLSRELRDELKLRWATELQPWFREDLADELQAGRTRRQCVREATLILLYTYQGPDDRRLRQLLLHVPNPLALE